jgi:putative Holliday junction resolvase
MILGNFKGFPTTKLLGVDWGARRTGIAVSFDDGMFVATRPVITMARYSHAELAEKIAKIAADEKCSGIVIGLPLRMDGTESETTVQVREFANVLAEQTDLPIVLLDETLSSADAQETLGRVHRADIKEKLDSAAARVILENAISMIKRKC